MPQRVPSGLGLIEGRRGDRDSAGDARDAEHAGHGVRAAESSTESTDPPIVGGRATTVGAAGMARSSAYLALPGDDVARVEAGRRPADQRERARILRRAGNGGDRDLRGRGRQRPVGRGAPVRRDDHGIARRERRRGDTEALRGRGDQPCAGRGCDGTHGKVERVHRVRSAGELVPQELGAGVVEHDIDGLEAGVQLLGRDDAHGRRDSLAHLGPGHMDHDPVRGGDLDLEQVRRGQRGEGQGVAEVDDVGYAGRRGRGRLRDPQCRRTPSRRRSASGLRPRRR